MIKFQPVPVNVFESMVAYDPASKDKNSGRMMRSEQEKRKLVLDTFEQYRGKQIAMVNVSGGETRVIEVEGIFGRIMIQHMLFGNWRIATPEDIAKSEKIELDRAEREAKREAVRQAGQAGRFFSETLDAAQKIVRFNDAQEKSEKAEKPEKPESSVKGHGKEK